MWLWDDGFGAMTLDQARWVRKLRVDEDRTWRWIAEECAEAWGGDWESNQYAGMEICLAVEPMTARPPRYATVVAP